ncbi:MAG: hypothetical protein ABIQ79_01945 [Nitrospiraceae bacterium]
MRPRVPQDQIDAASAMTNPLPADQETIANGKVCMKERLFAKRVMGRTGKGWTVILNRGI